VTALSDAPPPPPSPVRAGWADRALTLSLRRPALALTLTTLSTIGLGAALPALQRDVRIEKVFPERSEHRAAYDALTTTFGREDETALALVELPGDVLSAEALGRLHELTRALTRLDLVDGARVVSLTNATLARVTGPEELELGPLFTPDQAPGWDRAHHERLLASHPAFADRLLSRDRRLAGFLIPLEPPPPEVARHDETTRRRFAQTVRAFFAAELRPDEQVHLDGFAITNDTVLTLLEQDLGRFLPLSIGLLFVALGLVFRRVLPTLLAVVTVILSVVWTLGAMALLGIPFNFISTTIPVMVLVVCVGDAVHLIARFHQRLQAGLAPRPAMEEAVREVGRACFFTSVTTAAGFLSLLTSQVEVVRELGAPVALGVLFAYLLTLLLVPPVLAWAPAPKRFGGTHLLAGPLDALARLVARRPGAITAGTALLMLGCLLTAPTVSRETRLLQGFDEDQPIVQTRRLFEQRMGGVAPVEVLIDAGTPGRALDPDVQQGVLDLCQALRSPEAKEQGVLYVLSLADLLADAHWTWKGRASEAQGTLPADRGKLQDLLNLYRLFADPDPTVDLVDDPDAPQVLRVQIRIENLETTPFWALIDRVRREAQAHLPADVAVRVSGNTVMSQAIHHTLIGDMLRSFGLAFALVGALVLVFFRSPRLALLGMLPNLLPLLLILACMSLTGTALSLTTSIVFTVVFGISVDDTIHFVAALAQNEQANAAPDPITATLRGTGLSLVLSSAVLVGGFSVLLVSNFSANQTFGALIAATAVFALVGDLVLLPALLWLLRRRSGSPSGAESGPEASR
jgi:hydrophobe/amphiphile efflux-3 (HAE3) family protein